MVPVPISMWGDMPSETPGFAALFFREAAESGVWR
jgi:hypothetical protein